MKRERDREKESREASRDHGVGDIQAEASSPGDGRLCTGERCSEGMPAEQQTLMHQVVGDVVTLCTCSHPVVTPLGRGVTTFSARITAGQRLARRNVVM